MKKTCNICNDNKDIELFDKRKDSKDGYRNCCKECDRKRRRLIYNINIENEHKRYNERVSYFKNYNKKRRDTDPLYKLKSQLNTMINKSLKRNGYTKNSKSLEILGCSYDEFKLYLENQFEPWMNWDNYGKWNGEINYGWDIDHIVPTSSGNTENDIIKLNHYTNLRPLCSQINRYIKKDKVDY